MKSVVRSGVVSTFRTGHVVYVVYQLNESMYYVPMN